MPMFSESQEGQTNYDPRAELLAKLKTMLPKEQAEHSEIHTADINFLSSTGIGLEQNKGFNTCRSEVISALPKMLDAILISIQEDFFAKARLVVATDSSTGDRWIILKSDFTKIFQAVRSSKGKEE